MRKTINRVNDVAGRQTDAVVGLRFVSPRRSPNNIMTVPTSTDGNATATLVAPLPVPTHGDGGLFSVRCTAQLPAAPLTCLLATLDATRYAEWNSYCPDIHIDAQPTDAPADTTASHLPPLPTTFADALADTHPARFHLGTKFTMMAYTKGPGVGSPHPTKLQVSALAALADGRSGYVVAWKGVGYSDWTLRTERVQEFVARADGGTDYTSWETMGGVLARVVKGIAGGDLPNLFMAWANDLGRWCEGVETRGGVLSASAT